MDAFITKFVRGIDVRGIVCRGAIVYDTTNTHDQGGPIDQGRQLFGGQDDCISSRVDYKSLLRSRERVLLA